MRASRPHRIARTVSILVAGVLIASAGLETKANALTPAPHSEDSLQPMAFLDSFIETDKTVYSLGQQVHVVHRVESNLDEPWTLWPVRDPWWNLHVFDEGGSEVWTRFRAFLHYAPPLVFAPGEWVEYEYTWDLTDLEGNPVAPGRYELAALISQGPGSRTWITVAPAPEPGALLLMLAGFTWPLARRRKRATGT